MTINFRILSKVQADYCQELLDSIPAKRLEIIQAAMIDHIADRPRGKQPTALKTIMRIDAETQQFITETHKKVGGLGGKKTSRDVRDESYAINCIREEYSNYHILYKKGKEYLLFKAISSIQI
jgi:hypothetical protein